MFWIIINEWGGGKKKVITTEPSIQTEKIEAGLQIQ
jgi:hypothetical protein